MASKPAPQLPPGNSSMLWGSTENLSFHSSAEAFISDRIIQHNKTHPNDVRKRSAVRAKILNRNVIIASAYHQIQQILNAEGEGDSTPFYVAEAPYRRLMDAFFPPPNLLLQDGPAHQTMKTSWRNCVHSSPIQRRDDNVKEITREWFEQFSSSTSVDLYEKLKGLSWKIFLSTFLDIDEKHPEYDRFISLQENLLRGQFSLMPLSVNAGFWHSPRKVGIDARKELQRIISGLLSTQKPVWISEDITKERPQEEIVNHILMATSSLAVKGFASLLLAFLLNVFIFQPENANQSCLSDQMGSLSGDERRTHLNAILTETMRLSPPIVGVMRRATGDRTVSTQDEEEPDVLIPKDYDVWCYFPGGNRDPAVFGEDADLFKPERYLDRKDSPKEPIAFGAGSKACVGSSFVLMAAVAVADALHDSNTSLQGSVEAAGVRGWLGWEIASPEQWAQDVKQLPTQRPSRSIEVQVVKRQMDV